MKVKILIIRLSSIGDIVLTSLVVRCLKSQLENAEIHFVTKQQFVCILKSNPYIDKIHVFEDNLGDLINELAPEKFNFIIDLHHNFRSGRIKRNIKAKAFSVNKLNLQKMLLINFKIHRLPNKHIVDRYLETVAPLQIKNDGKGLDFFIPEKEQFVINDLPGPFQKGYVAFVIAGTYATKKLPVEKISEICRKTNYPVILLGGKKEFDEGEKVLSQSKGNVLNYAGKISLNKSASLVRDAKVVLTNDTGLMHIAAAFQKKILSFWGNTVADFGMEPYQPHPASMRLEVENLKCRPCSKLGFQKCPKKHFKCMNEIRIEDAVKWIDKNW
ncbi:MAG TPA: glycosyltransferase family 9 protein [Draconibacterium sp.]|nr:glycosyltransferase family 9 protein [Draconibacterium sp.]